MKKIIGILFLCLVLASIPPVFGDTGSSSRIENFPIDARLQVILHVEEPFNLQNHAGAVTFLQTGEFVALRVDNKQITLEKYTSEGQFVHSLSIPAPSDGSSIFDRATGFLVEVDDGRIFANNGFDAFEIDSTFSTITKREPLGFMPMDFRTKDTTIISQTQTDWPTDSLKLNNFSNSKNPMDFVSNPWIMIRNYEMGLALPEGYALNRIMGSDFGETTDSLYALVAAKTVPGAYNNEYYIIQLEKNLIEGKVKWERIAWIPIQRLGDTQIPTLRVTKNGFEILERNQSAPGGATTRLHRLNLAGVTQETVEIQGDVKLYDANGDQSIVSSWTYDGRGSTVYLVNWDYIDTGSSEVTVSHGRSKSLIHERSMNGKTLARFKKHSYGLLKQIEEETGIVDYLAPLKTDSSDVLLQIPLEDLVEKLDQQARNLEILYGDDHIVIPIISLDCRTDLNKLPCDTDATIEIHLIRQEDGLVQWTTSLYAIEQVDEKTKLVHRINLN